MSATKLKITLISFLIVSIILGNFWYYIHSSRNDTLENSVQKPATITKKTGESTITLTKGVSNQETVIPTRKKNIQATLPSNAIKNTTTDAESSNQNETTNYAVLENIFDKSWHGNNNNYSHYWGKENVSSLGDNLIILYPKGSNIPSNSPRGGAGFVYSFPKSYNRLSLSYVVRFEDGFDFVKGGKLPGLCGGNCSRGETMSTASGFSMRFIWKKSGYLDIMTFLPNTVKPGNYSGEKMFQFVPGKEYLLTQQITLNDIGKENGIITILVDGNVVYTKNNITIRIAPDVEINSFLFSTFFGGKDETYSTPKDTHIYFGKFKISDTF